MLITTLLPFFLFLSLFVSYGTTPTVGEKAPDFTLVSLNGEQVKLSERTANSQVVLVVLRGYPGYQCPYCNLQAQDFIKNAAAFSQAGAHIILVYPGPGEKLDDRAKEFLKDKQLPEHFDLLLDPDYNFTNLYGLRWDAPQETAYPSTFLIDQNGTVFFAKVSKSHGGRTKAAELLEELTKKKS